jgi:hypothetical protein
MQFGEAEPAVSEPDPSDALHLPPAALAIQATQPGQLADAAASRYRFDVGQVADNLKVHPGAILARLRLKTRQGFASVAEAAKGASAKLQ